ncbi:MAG: AI-2E family transporter [Oscillospiraceae bacterium]|nr:AI-2E family transporter [Oscillospiraceae bacterium]
MRKLSSNKYYAIGLTAFFVIAACILFYSLISHLSAIGGVVKVIYKILSPFIWGLFIAYLVYPIMWLSSRYIFTPLSKKLFKKAKSPEKTRATFAKALSLILAMVLFLFIVTAIIWMIVPQVVESADKLVKNSEYYYGKVSDWLGKILADYPGIEETAEALFGSVSETLTNWIKGLVPRMANLVTSLTSGVFSVVKELFNVIIGIIVSVYVLANLSALSAGVKRVLYCIFSIEAAERILYAGKTANNVFMSFISGKLLDSLIIGILCYIACLIMKMPYAVLVSVIIGITNIIPFFGPFIGAIPTAFIILLNDPIKCLIFIIFIVLLQQFDGNVLGPKILGDSIGINGFWVMFAIILGGGFFGFTGMLLGVPVFVLIYRFVNYSIEKKLRRSGLPTTLEEYKSIDHFDKEGNAVPITKKEALTEKGAQRRQRRLLRKMNRLKGLSRFKSEETSPEETPGEDEKPSDEKAQESSASEKTEV